MGDPAASSGGQALENIAQRSPPRTSTYDPLWADIESTFSDILGQYANLDLDMPIKPPDMESPQDQMRYLKDLEALGMSSAPSAALMGSNIRAAMELIKAQGEQQKQTIDMLTKVAPLVADNPEMSAFLGVNILNTIFPGQFSTKEKPGLERGPPPPTVTRLTPENVEKTEVYKTLSALALPQVEEIMRGKNEESLQEYFDTLEAQLIAAKLSPDVVRAITEALHKAAGDTITHEGITF